MKIKYSALAQMEKEKGMATTEELGRLFDSIDSDARELKIRHRDLKEISAALLAEAASVLEALEAQHTWHKAYGDGCHTLCARIEPLRAVIAKAGGAL